MKKTKCCTEENPCHSAELSRLNRISGQVEGIKKMIEDNRYCLDIISQISAARAALKAVEINILERHLSHCMSNAIQNNEDKSHKIQEILTLFKRNN